MTRVSSFIYSLSNLFSILFFSLKYYTTAVAFIRAVFSSLTIIANRNLSAQPSFGNDNNDVFVFIQIYKNLQLIINYGQIFKN